MHYPEERFASLLQTAFNKRNGNRIRHLVRIITNAYSQNPKELKNYFDNKNELVAGIATSAYYFLTSKIKPIRKAEFGGLGAIINQSKKNLKFKEKQLWFAKISGDSLRYSKNKEQSLWYSKNSGDSLWHSKNRDDSSWCSKNSGCAFWYSKNKGNVLWYSENSGGSLGYSENSDFSLFWSRNSHSSLRYSENSCGSLFGSKNSEDSLRGAKNCDFLGMKQI